MKQNQLLILTLLGSLMLHGLFSLVLLQISQWPSAQEAPTPIEVVFTEKKGPQRPLFFRPKDAPKPKNPIDQLKEKAQRLSDVTQRFKKQMVANKIGPTQNKKNQARKASPKKAKPQKVTKNQLYKKGQILKEASRDLKERQFYFGESSLRQRVNGVRRGGFTSLNTDQFIHYTFFARVNEQVLNRWILNVQKIVDDFRNKNTLPIISRKNHVTQVEVVLDDEGNYLDTHIRQSSGVKGVDQAVVKAFEDAAPIKNPPEEMLEADGRIHLRYKFHLVFDPRRLAQGS